VELFRGYSSDGKVIGMHSGKQNIRVGPLPLDKLPLVQVMEDLFQHWAAYLALMVEAASVLFIAIGTLEAIWMLVRLPREGRRKAVWVRFGVWLLLSLEFQVGADIIRTAISPTWTQIGQLGAIAVIRTFLNYFLEADMDIYKDPGKRAEGPLPADKAA
jgi:uncharacterized membrane protein